MAEVHVDVFHFACVDAFTDLSIGLVWEANLYAVGGRKGAIKFRTSGCTGENTDAKGLSLIAEAVDAIGEGSGKALGITGAGESTHADVVAIADQGSSLISGHDALLQDRVEYAIMRCSTGCHKLLFLRIGKGCLRLRS